MTERSGQASFGYRIGMAMTDWVGRRLIGLQSTTHAEHSKPPSAGSGWILNSTAKMPDLYGTTPDGSLWVLEAKGGRKVGLPELRKGAEQLNVKNLVVGGHNRVLCGASVEDRLFLTLDVDQAVPPASGVALSSPPTDPDHLQAFMLRYLALTSLQDEELAAVRLDAAQDPGQMVRLPGSSQDEERPSLMAPPEPNDFVVGHLPGTDLTLGMPAVAFLACEQLVGVQDELVDERTKTRIREIAQEQRNTIEFSQSRDADKAVMDLRQELSDKRGQIRDVLADRLGGATLSRSRKRVKSESPRELLAKTRVALVSPDSFIASDRQQA